MSRHRRQQRKRLRRALDRVHPSVIDSALVSCSLNGRLPDWLDPTQRLAVLREIRRSWTPQAIEILKEALRHD